MQTQAPWSEIGRIQSDVQQIRNDIRGKVDDYKIHEISRRLDSLECSLREVGSEVAGFQSELHEVQEKIGRLEQPLDQENAGW